jgi:hypothetical protein
MKVIGKTDKGYILEASEREVSNFIGYYSEYAEKRPTIKIGDDLAIAAMFDQLRTLAAKGKAISEASKALTEIVGQLQIIDPVVKGLLPTDKGAA